MERRRKMGNPHYGYWGEDSEVRYSGRTVVGKFKPAPYVPDDLYTAAVKAGALRRQRLREIRYLEQEKEERKRQWEIRKAEKLKKEQQRLEAIRRKRKNRARRWQEWLEQWTSYDIRRALLESEKDIDAHRRLAFPFTIGVFRTWCDREGFERPAKRKERYRKDEWERVVQRISYRQWLREGEVEEDY